MKIVAQKFDMVVSVTSCSQVLFTGGSLKTSAGRIHKRNMLCWKEKREKKRHPPYKKEKANSLVS